MTQARKKQRPHRDDDTSESFIDMINALPPPTAEEQRQWAEEAAREVATPCAWRYCAVIYDPLLHRITGGWGPVACPHDHLPGWKARHPAGLPKPGWPGKITGRNGSRIQRSRARRAGILGTDGLWHWDRYTPTTITTEQETP